MLKGAMSPSFQSPLWSWGKQPTPCSELSCLSMVHCRLRVLRVLLSTIVFNLMMDLSRLIIVKFDFQTLWIYIKLTFPPQWQKLEHGVCFAKLITKGDLTLESWNTSFYKGGRYFYTQPGFQACLSVAAALSQWVQKQTKNNDYLHCYRALKSCELMSELAAMFTPLQKSNFQMFTLFHT